MEIVAWALVLLLGALSAYLALRKEEDPYPDAVRRLVREVLSDDGPGDPAPDDPPEVRDLREAIARALAASHGGGDVPTEQALRALVRYAREAVAMPLREALERGGAEDSLADALAALEDLEAYSETREDEALRRDNLVSVIQSVTREYALQTGVPVKFRSPGGALPVQVASEGFKDALYLLLANAGHFGGGRTVDVVTELEGGEVRVRVLDRGPGFEPEALERAFEPFWSTESDALGLGLTQARKLLSLSGARLAVGNRGDGEGGAEASISLPRSD